MKTSTSKLASICCHSRFVLAVALGLGVGCAMSKSLGVAVGFAIGGSITVVMLARNPR